MLVELVNIISTMYSSIHGRVMENTVPVISRQGISGMYSFQESSLATTASSNVTPEVRSFCKKSSENLHLLVNETSLAFYRIEEHIVKTVPHLQGIAQQVKSVETKAEGAGFDQDYTAQFLDEVEIIPELQSVQGWVKNALVNASKIKELQDRRGPT
eukprot:sb/3473072/